MHFEHQLAEIDSNGGETGQGLQTLLLELARLDVRVTANGDKLDIKAPRGALTGPLLQRLDQYKAELLAIARRSNGLAREMSLPELVSRPEERHNPFPLTDIQHAYWLGRDSALEMGDVATHLYVELDCEDLDVERLNTALCRMIERHEMLRAVVDRDGRQRILTTVPPYRIAVTDLREASEAAQEEGIAAARGALSHQVMKADQWPLFEVRATLVPHKRVRLHVSLDLLILDAWSIALFFREWHRFYIQPEGELPTLAISYRDYVLAERSRLNSEAYQRSLGYWTERLDSLPPAPDLPLRPDPAARRSPRFSRRLARLEKTRWEKLKALGRAHSLTPSALLAAAYAEVLARWCTSPHFTLNLTISNRLQLHKDVNSLLGDFTSLVLLEADRRDSRMSFVQFAARLQKQFADDLENSAVSGVVVMREWAKRRGLRPQAIMPVVFSSGLIWSGDKEVGDLEQFGSKVFSVSQTSQAWLDHHVMEANGDLIYNWDAADAVFEPGVLDNMFAAYCELIEGLVDQPSLWTSPEVVSLPADMIRRRQEANATDAPRLERQLHAGFVGQARSSPQALALVAAERSMTYGELLAESCALADRLLTSGIGPGQPVAVVMHKGWEQIVAVFGVLLAGGAYVPVDANLPGKRQAELLRICKVAQVLSQPGVRRNDTWPAEVDVIEVLPGRRADFRDVHQRSLEAPLDQLAYVIFTSGTTGVPKGVMIDHRGATNTIEHINRLHGIHGSDRVLAVSSLSFDLSVYDIFGLLSVGGALVIPDARKGHDPMHWRELSVRHGVTLWNSAPQLMCMLADTFQPGDRERAPLRNVFLSGDFIPLDLPGRIRDYYRGAKVVSMGGATEASIWSIHYPVTAVDPAWSSIPYGKPLPNQTVWVYDQALRPCPDHVKGHIYIGGLGLAQGYWHDQEKTAARFIVHPESGERFYDTGDLGRYAPDGNIVILGRDDGQVKIRGHRTELGEIESVLRQHPAVKQAVILAVAGPGDSRQLVAYVEAAGYADAPLLKDYLAERLPDYMVPRHIVTVDRMPVSANGKMDYNALPAIAGDLDEDAFAAVAPRDETEAVILEAWSRVISDCDIGVTDNFFELGGDSVLATQLVRELNAALPAFGLEMHELFENLTIESLAALYRVRTASGEQEAVAGQRAWTGTVAPSVDEKAMLADLAAAEDELARLDFNTGRVGAATSPQGILLTGATGWVGAHVLRELLTRTSATVYCLVRANGEAEGRKRLLSTLDGYGMAVDSSRRDRLVPLCGDLTQPGLGLGGGEWKRLASTVDAIYHLAASVNVLADYATHSKTNVRPLTTILRLAGEERLKSLFVLSPMTICRRFQDGHTVIFHDEAPLSGPDGLLTGYAQSKWAVERLLLTAIQRGLPAKIYRTSHALPAAASGLSKASDTYGSVLAVACEAGVIPDWEDSAFHGVPVDTLAGLLVEETLAGDNYQGVIHLENRDPPSFPSLLSVMLGDGGSPARVPLAEWKSRCRETAAAMGGEAAALAQVLFADRATGAAIDNMFAAHPVDTAYFEGRGLGAKLVDLTPPAYWRGFRDLGWQAWNPLLMQGKCK